MQSTTRRKFLKISLYTVFGSGIGIISLGDALAGSGGGCRCNTTVNADPCEINTCGHAGNIADCSVTNTCTGPNPNVGGCSSSTQNTNTGCHCNTSKNEGSCTYNSCGSGANGGNTAHCSTLNTCNGPSSNKSPQCTPPTYNVMDCTATNVCNGPSANSCILNKCDVNSCTGYGANTCTPGGNRCTVPTTNTCTGSGNGAN